MRYLKLTLIVIAAALVILVAVGLIWALNPSQAEQVTLDQAIANPDVRVAEEGDFIVLQPTNGTPKTGLLFYPGMHVASEAYIHKLAAVVEATGIGIVIGRPPLGMAFFAVDQADAMREALPDIESWYVGGHSLGGAVACAYASTHAASLEGVILLGTYCGSDLAGSDLRVLIVSGESDGLFPPEKIEDENDDLPAGATVAFIPGMNHAQIGNYGDQFGDAPALISDEEASRGITAKVAAFLQGE